MLSRALVTTIMVVCTIGLPSPVDAQRPRAVSLDVTAGPETVHTAGEYRDPQRVAAVDGLLAVRLRAAGSGTLVAGLLAGMPLPYGTTAICLPSSTGGCIRSYPHFLKAGALVGWEHASTRVRAMAGPVHLDAEGTRVFGVEGRLDGSLPLGRHLALIASFRGTMAPSYRGDEVRVSAFAAGLRIQ